MRNSDSDSGTRPSNCPVCHSVLFTEHYQDLVELNCVVCGFSQDITPERPKPPPIEIDTVKPLARVHGISARESRRIYAKTPAGKAARKRYHTSPLFKAAHARHRQTDKYRASQERFKTKQKLFRNIRRQLDIQRNGCDHYYLDWDTKIFTCKDCGEIVS